MQINVEINDLESSRRMAELAAEGRNLHPLMLDIGEEMRRVVEGNFAEGGRPEAWKPSPRSRRDGGKPLTDSGRLRRSITVDAVSDRVRVGTNVAYARIHQLGGKTKPHTIRPVHARALFWPGAKHPVKAVSHPGSNIPARPFLILGDADVRRIEQIAADFMGGKA